LVSSATWVRNWSASCAPASGAASSFADSRTMRAAWSLAAAITGLPHPEYHGACEAKETVKETGRIGVFDPKLSLTERFGQVILLRY
jgi:hypothetical protein